MFLTPSFRSVAQSENVRPASLLRSVSTAALTDSMESEAVTWRARAQGDTPLERTIDAIGVGRYQVALLFLSGFGWAADNMWLQGIAIILPRVQADFGVGDRYIGLLSSSTFAGMMVGALAWGTWSDAYGRAGAFNGTLVIVTLFGSLAAFAPSFSTLCILLFLLGLGLGGSIPTDGNLALENLPTRKHYLLTALSVFFAAGSVASSILGLLIIPGSPSRWRWFLASLGVVTAIFLLLRVVFFRILESPRYLVSSGRAEEARVALSRIAAFNGAPLPVALSDVDDSRQQSTARTNRPASSTRGGYSALATDPQEGEPPNTEPGADQPDSADEVNKDLPPWLADRLPDQWQKGISTLQSTYSILLNKDWKRTTLLVWGIWSFVTLSFTMFNVFLPKLLEARLPPPSSPPTEGKAEEDGTIGVMQDYLLYSLASLPGSLLGAYSIETSLGRKGTMALSLFITSLSILFFLYSHTRPTIVTSSMMISLSATIGYAAIYGYTPEVFETEVRGTANGTASALSRLAGMIAPILAGILFEVVSLDAPLIVAVVLLMMTVGMCLALPIETRGRATTTAAAAEGGR